MVATLLAVVLPFAVYSLRAFIKEASSDDPAEWGVGIPGSLISVVVCAISVPICSISAFNAAKVAIAPRLVLLEHVAELIQ